MNTKFLSLQQKDNLSVAQFSVISGTTLDIITSTFALKNKMMEVTEVSQGGSVNELLVVNHSDKYIFMMDGDILDGAKQNRVLNTSVFLAPQSKTRIPVSCVERGRWGYKSKEFKPTDYVAPAKLRANKSHQVFFSLHAEQGHRSDQGKVWSDVDQVSDSLGVMSASSNLSDVFEGSKDSYQKFLDSFHHEPGANGVLFFVNRKPLAMDIFNREGIMQEYFPKLLKGIAMDVHGMENNEGQMPEAEASYKTIEFVDRIETLEQKVYPGVALGEEKRFQSENISGFELAYKGELIHLTALSLDTSENKL